MNSANSAVKEQSVQKSTASSSARLTPQQLAEVSGKAALENLNENIAKLARGEKAPQQ
jgi:hypothetical protein